MSNMLDIAGGILIAAAIVTLLSAAWTAATNHEILLGEGLRAILSFLGLGALALAFWIIFIRTGVLR